jgi:hypothetical protein
MEGVGTEVSRSAPAYAPATGVTALPGKVDFFGGCLNERGQIKKMAIQALNLTQPHPILLAAERKEAGEGRRRRGNLRSTQDAV